MRETLHPIIEYQSAVRPSGIAKSPERARSRRRKAASLLPSSQSYIECSFQFVEQHAACCEHSADINVEILVI